MSDEIEPRPIIMKRESEEDRAKMKQQMLERMAAAQQLSQRNETLFLNAWKRGVQLAGEEYFYAKTPSFSAEKVEPEKSIEAVTDKNQLCPDQDMIEKCIGGLSGGKRRFLAAMCSIYNSEWGADLMDNCDARGLANLTANLDGEHRQVIADLIVSYQGW